MTVYMLRLMDWDSGSSYLKSLHATVESAQRATEELHPELIIDWRTDDDDIIGWNVTTDPVGYFTARISATQVKP